MFTCIYCFKHKPEVIPTVAHIFPNAMGGISSSKKTVCKNCNTKTNKDFEQTEIDKFSFFLNIWGIKSRKGKIKKVRASVDFGERRFNVALGEFGLPLTPLVFVDKDEKGKKRYGIIGDVPMIKEKKEEIEAKNPDIKWVEKNLDDAPWPESVIEIASDLTRKTLRRLATKVAYERWGQLKNSDLLNDRQYNEIRNFILTGSETRIICGLLYDQRLLNGILNFPIGYHSVVIIANPNSRILGAFVSFFSLFYFWVILSTNYQALTPFDDALIEDPQR
jgi:hypothetical protein